MTGQPPLCVFAVRCGPVSRKALAGAGCARVWRPEEHLEKHTEDEQIRPPSAPLRGLGPVASWNRGPDGERVHGLRPGVRGAQDRVALPHPRPTTASRPAEKRRTSPRSGFGDRQGARGAAEVAGCPAGRAGPRRRAGAGRRDAQLLHISNSRVPSCGGAGTGPQLSRGHVVSWRCGVGAAAASRRSIALRARLIGSELRVTTN